MANRNSKSSVLTRRQVLALNIAAHTGYSSLHEAGTWSFTESKRRNGNKMHGALRTTLLPLLRHYGIRRVAAEDVSMNRHFYDVQRPSGLKGTLLEMYDELGISEPEFVDSIVLKRWATGDGHATKMQMVTTYKDRYGIVPVGDNVADAYHLSCYHIRGHRL